MKTGNEALEDVLDRKAELDFAAASGESPGAGLRWFGRTAATRFPALPGHVPYNKVRGYRAGDRRRLPAMLDFYRSLGLAPAVEVRSDDDTPEVRRTLADAGLAPGESTVLLRARPARSEPALPVREAAADDEEYLQVLLEGFGVGDDRALLRRMFAVEHSTPGIRRFLAYSDGAPVAAGSLYTGRRASLLAGAATLPALRNRGFQSALVAARLTGAAESDGPAIVTAAERSASHANLTRLGFTLAQRRTVWR
ncbi:hypothetical protein [Salininema proteolyticum]|uniref:N-acetyltransferase domain-containing protein n=1 Tax=Salininema proteolyticum TaxID=1607685 RepID=A0ABV8U1Z5_9ACTN